MRDPAALPEPVKAAVRARLGLNRTSWSVSSAAPIAPDVLRFFEDLGLRVREGWGMSETSCLVTVNPVDAPRPGTVGRALPGVEFRILEDGEVAVRGPLVMKGYRDDPERTAEVLGPDGWLHTGDVATVEADGYLTIVDRKKELIINSAGKNMSPANIENRRRATSPLIGQAVCIGDRRPYNVALLVLDPDAAGRWAAARGRHAAVADHTVMLLKVDHEIPPAEQALGMDNDCNDCHGSNQVDWVALGWSADPLSGGTRPD